MKLVILYHLDHVSDVSNHDRSYVMAMSNDPVYLNLVHQMEQKNAWKEIDTWIFDEKRWCLECDNTGNARIRVQQTVLFESISPSCIFQQWTKWTS